jgi:ferredoxin
MLYFSGTGNSKYIAELFCQNMESECISIEDDVDFGALFASNDTIGFCYPVYSSRVPRIMREFTTAHMELLKNKKLIVFCTQMIFSGDGARAFTDLFPRGSFDIIYAEHFLMPNNVCNFFITPLANEGRIKNYLAKAERKIQIVCGNIESGIVKKRGFNVISRLLGLPQGIFLPLIERKARKSVKIAADCTTCGLCVSICPMKNLRLENEKVAHEKNCTLCYRCINRCPKKAITIFFHDKVKRQYKGV